MDWSPSDKKSTLLNKCKERGLPASKEDLKQDLINLLTANDLGQEIELRKTNKVEHKEPETKELANSPVPEESWDPPKETSPAALQEPGTLPPLPDPVTPLKPAPVQAQTATEPPTVLDYLVCAVDRVSLQQLLKECGENALTEVKKLVSEHKVMQFRQHNKFWFQARYR